MYPKLIGPVYTLLSVLVSSGVVLASFTISPPGPTLAQCSQVDLVWTEEPPIQLWVAPNRQIAPGDPTLETLGPINASFLLWTVDLPVGQNISFTYIQLVNQYLLYSSPQQYTVVEGSTSDCLQTLSPVPSATPAPSSSGRPAGWIAGVALASVGSALILLGLSWFAIAFLRRRRARSGAIYLLPASRSQGNEKGGESGAAGSEERPRKFRIVSARRFTLFTVAEQPDEGTSTASGDVDVEKSASPATAPAPVPEHQETHEVLNEKTPVAEAYTAHAAARRFPSGVPESVDGASAYSQNGDEDPADPFSSTHGIIEEPRR